jgi:hypothetical protein
MRHVQILAVGAVIASLVAVSVAASSAGAQNGGARSASWSVASPDGHLIVPGTDTFAVYLVRQGKRQRIAYVVDAIAVDVGAAGDTLLRREYSFVDERGSRVDTIVDHRATLRMRRYWSRIPSGGLNSVVFDDGHLTGSVSRLGRAVAIDTLLPDGAYNGATLDLVLRSSPLALGYAVEVPSFIPEHGVVPLRARVAALDTLAGDGVYWRVNADFAGLPATFWINRRTRKLGRQVLRPGNDVTLEFVPLPRSRT